jgi:hypothetical protein
VPPVTSVIVEVGGGVGGGGGGADEDPPPPEQALTTIKPMQTKMRLRMRAIFKVFRYRQKILKAEIDISIGTVIAVQYPAQCLHSTIAHRQDQCGARQGIVI